MKVKPILHRVLVKPEEVEAVMEYKEKIAKALQADTIILDGELIYGQDMFSEG